jgi:hypothetical protein
MRLYIHPHTIFNIKLVTSSRIFKSKKMQVSNLGGGAFVPLLSTWTRGGVVKCPRLSTRGGEGVKIGQILGNVVVE